MKIKDGEVDWEDERDYSRTYYTKEEVLLRRK